MILKEGGVILYVREDTPSNLIAFEEKPNESFFIEINLQNKKMLINCSYNPHKSEIKKHLTALRHSLDSHSSKYDKVLILGDFNVGIEEANMQSFCESYNVKNLIKQSTCYKNPDKPTCIDLILTNVPRMLQSTWVIETRLSDFHLMTMTVMRKTFKKLIPRIISYRSYKDFSNETFRDCLVNNLSNEIFFYNDNEFEKF